MSALVKLVFTGAEGNVSKQAQQCYASETYKVLWKLTVQSPALFSGVRGGEKKGSPKKCHLKTELMNGRERATEFSVEGTARPKAQHVCKFTDF